MSDASLVYSPTSCLFAFHLSKSWGSRFRKKAMIFAIAALTLSASIMASASPAEARKRHNGGEAALALGLFGVVAAGLLLAGSQQGYANDGYYDGGYEPDNYGAQLVHYPQRRHYQGWFNPHRPQRHGFYSRQCRIETRHVQGRHGRIFTQQYRICR